MFDLNEIAIFTKVAQTNSFTEAGKSLGLPKSTVSRKVSSLEKRLGVALLTRTTRSLSLTEAGQSYFRECSRILSELNQIETATLHHQASPQGVLRLTAPLEFGPALLTPIIEQFMQKYPNVEVEMLLTDRVIDLLGESVDVAIRAGELDDSSLIAKRLGSMAFLLVASPEYLKKHGTPQSPEDLAKHKCLRFTSIHDKPVWELTNGKSRKRVAANGACRADNLTILRELATRGAGIVLLPPFMCCQQIKRGELVHILQDWRSDEDPAYVVYPASKFVAPKVRAFIDVLTAGIRDVFNPTFC